MSLWGPRYAFIPPALGWPLLRPPSIQHARPLGPDYWRASKPNTVELAITPLAEGTSGSLSPRGRGLG